MDMQVRASEDCSKEALNVNNHSNYNIDHNQCETVGLCIEQNLSNVITCAYESGTIERQDAELIRYSQGIEAWPEPQALIESSHSAHYPVHVFPEIIRDAIEEITRFIQCPISMVGSSALGGDFCCSARLGKCYESGRFNWAD